MGIRVQQVEWTGLDERAYKMNSSVVRLDPRHNEKLERQIMKLCCRLALLVVAVMLLGCDKRDSTTTTTPPATGTNAPAKP